MHLKCLEQRGPDTLSKKKTTTIIVVVIIVVCQVYISFLRIVRYESSAYYLKNMWKMGQSIKKI